MPTFAKVARVRIEGRVQGVGFRAWTQARALGLTGWVVNRRDAGAEALFAGCAHCVNEMITRCHAEPPSAGVEMIEVLPETCAMAAGFGVLPTR